MKQWLVGNIQSADNLSIEENFHLSNKEFTVLLGMVGLALALFGIIVRVIGA